MSGIGSGMPGCWLTTERLGLRRFQPSDADWLASLYGDPEVTRFLGGVKDRSGTEALFKARFLDYYDQHAGLGIWLTIERASGRPIGFHALNHIQGESFVQIGFVLAKEAWGRGLAAEMAVPLLRYGFTELALPKIVGIASLGNLASHRVLRKVGLHRHGERTLAHPAYAAEGPMAWFERDAGEWLEQQGSG